MADSQRKTANLFDYVSFYNNASSSQCTKSIIPTGIRITATGSDSYVNTVIRENEAVPSYLYNACIEIKPNTTYTLYLSSSPKCYVSQVNSSYIGTSTFVKLPVTSQPTTYTFTTDSTAKYVLFRLGKDGMASGESYDFTDIMLVEDETAPTVYEPYWVHSLRKLTTATEAVENPLYSDGTAITAYTIKGNTVQNGTPTPSNPVEVNGVGERTENVYNKYNVIQVANLGTRYGSYVDNGVYSIYNDTDNDVYWGGNDFQSRYLACSPHSTATVDMTSYSYSDYGFIMAYNDASLGDITIVEGSTAPDHYIPYGYKITILSPVVTTNIDLGSTQTVRQIKKLVFTGDENWRMSGSVQGWFYLTSAAKMADADMISNAYVYYPYPYAESASVPNGGFAPDIYDQTKNVYTAIVIRNTDYSSANAFKDYLAAQYAAGTPVTVWYILATPTTDIVNEPLMKIGDYADTLSNAASIPTTEGANSITVDTTVQPSEFTATWTGWHDANVKEWDGSDWQ